MDSADQSTLPDKFTPPDQSTPTDADNVTPAEADQSTSAEADNFIPVEADNSITADDPNPPLSQAAPDSPLPAQVDSNPSSPTPKSSHCLTWNLLHLPVSLDQEQNWTRGSDPVDTGDPQSAQDQDDQDGDQTTRLPSDPLLAPNRPPLTGSAQDQDKPGSSQQTSVHSTSSTDDPNRKTPVDFNSSEVIQALQPLGPGQGKSPQNRWTPLRNLPKMLRNFQNSHETLYFTEGGLQEIQQFADASPDLMITSDEIVSLLEKAKNTHVLANLLPDHTGPVKLHPPSLDYLEWPSSASGSGSQHSLSVTNPDRFSSTESPSTHHGGRPGAWFGRNFPRLNDPFSEALASWLVNLSDDEGLAHSEPDSPLNKAPSRQAKRDAAPGPDSRHDRPKPPRRKKKSPSSFGVINPIPDPLSLSFPDDPDSPGTHENFLEVMTKLKHEDLHPSELDSDLRPSDGSELCPNELSRRLRPCSNVFRRPYESTDSIQYQPPTVNKMYEDYPMMQKAYSDLHHKALDMEKQLEHQERLHEEEMVKMSDKIDELQHEVASRTKGERDKAHTANQQRIQLESADDEIEKLQKELASARANYSKIKLRWEEAVDELDKARTNLHEKEEELRHANRAIQHHNSDMHKWDAERRLLQEHMKAIQADVEQSQVAKDVLEEQKHANVELQMTLDRVRYELDEQQSLQSGLLSQPGSLPGRMCQSVGVELKKAMAAAEYSQAAEQHGGEGKDGDDAQIDRIVKKLDEGLGGDQDDIYEEIQIKQIKRRQFRNRSGTIVESNGSSIESDVDEIDEEILEPQDASTDTDNLIPTMSRHIYTEVVPEPPLLYRPKTGDLQVQREPLVVGLRRGEIEDLVEGVDIDVLREAIARIGRECAVGPVAPHGGFFSRLGLPQSIMNAIRPLNPYSSGTGGTSEGRLMLNAHFRLWTTALMLVATRCVIGQLVLISTNQRPAMMVVEFFRNSAGPSASGPAVGDVHGIGVSTVMGSKVWGEFFEVAGLGWDDMFLAHQVTTSHAGRWGLGSLATGAGGGGRDGDGGLSGGVWRKVYEFGMRVLGDRIGVAKRVSIQ